MAHQVKVLRVAQIPLARLSTAVEVVALVETTALSPLQMVVLAWNG